MFLIDHRSNTSYKFGFGFFETMRSIGNQIIFFNEHIERLNSSLKEFGLPPIQAEEIQSNLLSELKKLKIDDGRIRITYSLQNETPLITYEINNFFRSFPEIAKVTISSVRFKHKDELRKHKTTSYFLNYFEYHKARVNGFDEIIFFDEYGHLLEGSRTNIFLVFEGGSYNEIKIFTPNLECGLLRGIGRGKVFEICQKLNLSVMEALISLNDLENAKEIFLCNSLNGIIPVRFDKKKVHLDITNLISQEFQKYFTKQ